MKRQYSVVKDQIIRVVFFSSIFFHAKNGGYIASD